MSSTIVTTVVERIEDLPAAQWKDSRWQDSYRRTAEALKNIGERRDIRLIGRRDQAGHVWPCYSVSAHGELRAVTAWHLTLARFFLTALESAPAGDVLRPFLGDLPADVAAAARSLLASHAGIDAEQRAARAAANEVNADLAALGVPVGDWTFLPMLIAYRAAGVAA